MNNNTAAQQKAEGENCFDSLFDNLETELPKMSSADFISKSKKILEAIDKELRPAFRRRFLLETEFPIEDVCAACTGCGMFKDSDGEEQECYQDHVAGECYTNGFRREEFGEAVYEIICNCQDWHELLHCKIEKTTDNECDASKA